MISVELNKVFTRAVEYARHKHHEYLTIEHVFLAILSSRAGEELLRVLGADVPQMKKDIVVHIAAHVPKVEQESDPIETVPASCRREKRGDGRQHAGGDPGTERELCRLSDGKSGNRPPENPGDHFPSAGDHFPGKGAIRKRELHSEPGSGKIDPVIGREEEIERLMQTLCRRKKNNPLLVGEPGVGKTAIAEGLALRISESRVPETIRNAKIYALDLGSLLAGTKYRGDFEKRLKGVITELRSVPDAIVFVDEIHTLVGAGSTGSGSMDASNILKPALARGELRCIGATTHQEYRNFFDRDKALSRRFAKIEVEEPTPEDTFLILKGVRHRYEEHHGITFSDEALKTAVDLSMRYLHDRFLPDKAMDLIDEAGAHCMLKGEKGTQIGSREIAAILSRMLKLPPATLEKDETEKLKTLQKRLGKRIIGQEEAIRSVVRAIKRSYAGLNRPDLPIGSFLFVGPTGVGKTALARALAEELGIHFERIDMSEYMEKHAVSRLIGAPPGYVGYEQGGLLTEMIKKHPHTVLLMDEIEKAHPDIMNILLQVMDDARLTDNNGLVSDFKNVVLIMTSNLGADEAGVMGFAKDESSRTDRAMKSFFSPEFRNRLSATVQFSALDLGVLMRIVKLEIRELNRQLAEKRVFVKVDKKAREYIAARSRSDEFGARQIGRIIDAEIKEPLTDAILFGELREGGTVYVEAGEQSLKFRFGD